MSRYALYKIHTSIAHKKSYLKGQEDRGVIVDNAKVGGEDEGDLEIPEDQIDVHEVDEGDESGFEDDDVEPIIIDDKVGVVVNVPPEAMTFIGDVQIDQQILQADEELGKIAEELQTYSSIGSDMDMDAPENVLNEIDQHNYLGHHRVKGFNDDVPPLVPKAPVSKKPFLVNMLAFNKVNDEPKRRVQNANMDTPFYFHSKTSIASALKKCEV
ncbi:hypothetical protein LIER_28189 [Lithospermum erythrorhizon]|uniref:Uncharacterized protein n=1 Tax=Lithospermum erythrorhizon TaxID=34254 RepID=A0AAV3RHS6_LITER